MGMNSGVFSSVGRSVGRRRRRPSNRGGLAREPTTGREQEGSAPCRNVVYSGTCGNWKPWMADRKISAAGEEGMLRK